MLYRISRLLITLLAAVSFTISRTLTAKDCHGLLRSYGLFDSQHHSWWINRLQYIPMVYRHVKNFTSWLDSTYIDPVQDMVSSAIGVIIGL